MKRFSLLLCVAILLAGCTSPTSPQDGTDKSATGTTGGSGSTSTGGSGGDGTGSGSTQGTGNATGPVPANGTAWRFRADGLQDTVKDFTVVVATSDKDGYLFGASKRTELVDDIAWGGLWFGRHSLSLNPVDGKEEAPYLKFPLADGKTWGYHGGNVTVTAMSIPTPSGQEQGFRIKLPRPDSNVTWDFSPSIGFITSFTREVRGTIISHVAMQSVTTATSYVYYDSSGGGSAGGDLPLVTSVTISMRAGEDAMFAGCSGQQGGGCLVQPPQDSGEQPWTYTIDEAEAFVVKEFLPHEGDWQGQTLGNPQAYSFVTLKAVKWVDGTIK
jgi:hypothetical protein